MPDDGLLVANIDFDGIKGSLEIKQSPASTSVERDKSLVTALQRANLESNHAASISRAEGA